MAVNGRHVTVNKKSRPRRKDNHEIGSGFRMTMPQDCLNPDMPERRTSSAPGAAIRHAMQCLASILQVVPKINQRFPYDRECSIILALQLRKSLIQFNEFRFALGLEC